MPTVVYFFNAARCFRSEFRREIFAFAASSCPAFERLVRDGRSCGLFPLPADGIRGWVGCIVSRTIGCVRIGPADGDPALDMPVNAPGHVLFQTTSRMSNVADRAVRDCRPSEPTPPPASRAARSAYASLPVLPRRSDAARWSRRNRPWSPSSSPRSRRLA